MRSIVAINVPEPLTRQLKKLFNSAADAVYTTAPVSRSQSMGLTGLCGTLSFMFLDGGSANATTLWEWNQQYAIANAGNGWMKSGANSTLNTLSVDAGSRATAVMPEQTPFFLQVTTAVTVAWVSGTQDPGGMQNSDTTSGTNH